VKLGKAATKSAPDWARGWCLLGALQIDAGRIDASRRAYRRALDCIDDSWLVASDLDDTAWQARAGLARLHLGRGEYREAFECFFGAVAVNPTSAGLRVELAHLYEAFGRSVDNRDQLERAIGAGRVGPEAHLAFADFFTKRAEEALLRGLADNAESRALLERIESLRASSPST
jgi:Flp pilus assembly protein TadD